MRWKYCDWFCLLVQTCLFSALALVFGKVLGLILEIECWESMHLELVSAICSRSCDHLHSLDLKMFGHSIEGQSFRDPNLSRGSAGFYSLFEFRPDQQAYFGSLSWIDAALPDWFRIWNSETVQDALAGSPKDQWGHRLHPSDMNSWFRQILWMLHQWFGSSRVDPAPCHFEQSLSGPLIWDELVYL